MKPKYVLLYHWLLNQQKDMVTLTFEQVQTIVSEELPESAFKYKAWWENNVTNKSQVRAWSEAGYKSCNLDIPAQQVSFKKVHTQEE